MPAFAASLPSAATPTVRRAAVRADGRVRGSEADDGVAVTPAPAEVRERRMTGPDAAEFERAVLPHLDAAQNLARWLVSDATLAEDIVQEAALRALGYFPSYRGGDARAWFLRIVRNAAYGALAARRRGVTVALDGADADDEPHRVPDPADDPEAALARCQGLARLGEALAALPVDLRECLVLRELEELSYKEVAEITGVPIGTVMSRLWRARRALIGVDAEGATP